MVGTLIGDTVGSVYEFNNVRTKDFKLFSKDSFLTDDSIMTLAVAEILQTKCIYDKDKIIDTFKKWGRAYPDRGYGGMFYKWLFTDMRESYRSYGNGAAMRISPVGWYAYCEDQVKDFVERITEVTHSHPEGIKGAEVVAMCVFYAKIGKSKEFIKDYVSKYYDIDFDYEDLRKNYYFNETCQETVPQAIYCFLISESFEDCLRTTISIGGDCDTTAAISCAIAEAYYKHIDEDLINEVMKRVPQVVNGCNAQEVINKFNIYKCYELVHCEEITDKTMFVCFEETIQGMYHQEWIHSSDSRFLSNYLTWYMFDYYFETFDNKEVSKHLNELNYKECGLIVDSMYLKSHKFGSKVANAYKKYSKENSFDNLVNQCEILNDILYRINYESEFKCFNNVKEANIYKSIDTMSNLEVLDLFINKSK